MGGRVETDGQSAAPTIVGRGYRVDAGAGYTVAAIQQRLGQEMPDTTSMAAALETYHVVLLAPAMANRSLQEVTLPAGLHVTAIQRGDAIMPALPATRLQLHDILQIYDTTPGGGRSSGAQLRHIGKRMPDKLASNLGIAGLAIALGTLLGSFSLNVGGIPFSAGTGGGVLVVGLVLGWYHARRADLHTVNADALALMKDLGLAGFIAGVGLSSGPQAMVLIMQYGFSLPLLGYTITYAISNVVLPLMGPLIVGLASSLQPV